MFSGKVDKIGSREYFAIVLLVIGTKLTDMTPVLFYNETKNAAWMVPILTGIFSILPIAIMLYLIKKNNEKSILEVIELIMGKPLSKIIFILLFGIGIFGIALNMRSYSDVIHTMYFPRTPVVAIFLFLLFISSYGAKKGLEQIGSVAWLTLFYIKTTLIVGMLLMFNRGEIERLSPIWGPGKWEIIKTAFPKTSIYVEFIYFMILAPFLPSYKKFRNITWLALLFVMIEISLAVLLYVTMFDYPSIQKISYPFHEAIRYIKFSDFLANIETFFVPFWLVASIVRFAVYLYLSTMILSVIFNLDEFEDIVWPIAFLAFYIGMFPANSHDTLFLYKNKFYTYLTPLFFGLPILLLFIWKVKGVFQNEKI